MMKIFGILSFVVLIFVTTISCGSDDDICTSGEATPRMKVKFKDSNNKLVTLDSIYVDVDYGSGFVNIATESDADSILIPLRVDENLSTTIQIRTTNAGSKSLVDVVYTTKSSYVSPACGIKKVYENVGYTLTQSDPLTNVEANQTKITDENKTHLYFIF